jgi:hypothetical protein
MLIFLPSNHDDTLPAAASCPPLLILLCLSSLLNTLLTSDPLCGQSGSSIPRVCSSRMVALRKILVKSQDPEVSRTPQVPRPQDSRPVSMFQVLPPSGLIHRLRAHLLFLLFSPQTALRQGLSLPSSNTMATWVLISQRYVTGTCLQSPIDDIYSHFCLLIGSIDSYPAQSPR